VADKIMCTGWRYFCICPKHESEPDGLLIRSKRKGHRADRKELNAIRKTFVIERPEPTCTGSYTCSCPSCEESNKRLRDHRAKYATR